MLFGDFDDLVDVGIDVLLRGVEVANNDANDVGALELTWRAETFLDILHLLRYFFGELIRHLPIFILDLEEDDTVPKCMDAEQCWMILNGSNQFQCLFLIRLH